MGSGSWSSSTYKAFADSYTKKSREEIFHQRSLHEEMDLTKSKTHIRESRDSEEHPESLPVFIALDETGSMGSIPDKMIRDYLPKLMDSIIDSIGVKHPQILFMGVGDHECDYYPCGELKKYDIIPYLVDKYESLSRKNRPNLRLYNSVKEFIVKECRYQFWSRCEYEIIISSWPDEINKKKIDVYDQIVLNIDIITKILTSYLTMLGY